MAALFESLKTKILVVLIFISAAAPAQNFSPFNAKVTKRFYNSANPTDNSYFFYADSTKNPAPGKYVFHQYFTTQMPAGNACGTCGYWGGTMYYADTTWLGVDILYDSTTQRLVIKNFEGDSLAFDFSIQPGDSATFYQSTTDKYFIKAGQTQSESVYSVTDAVKTYTILHYDAGNQVVNSTLHGKQIKLGQQTGLIRFIDAYHFPAAERHLALQGQLNPLIGTYQMRFEDLYPFQAGDSMQYKGGSSPSPCTYVRNYRVLSRSETSVAVTIVFGKSLFHTSTGVPPGACPVPDIYPDVLTFPKNFDVIGYPYNRLDEKSHPLTGNGIFGDGYEIRKEVSTQTGCSNGPGYEGTARPAMYCYNRSCASVGSVDAQGFSQGLPGKYFVKGMGITSVGITGWSTGGQWTRGLSLHYSAIGGSVCGTYYAVGLPEHDLTAVSIYPSPTADELTISARIDQLSIFSADGMAVQTIFQPASTISVGHLPPGLYILHLRRGKSGSYSRIIKI